MFKVFLVLESEASTHVGQQMSGIEFVKEGQFVLRQALKPASPDARGLAT
jgi:hypothetical protein